MTLHHTDKRKDLSDCICHMLAKCCPAPFPTCFVNVCNYVVIKCNPHMLIQVCATEKCASVTAQVLISAAEKTST